MEVEQLINWHKFQVRELSSKLQKANERLEEKLREHIRHHEQTVYALTLLSPEIRAARMAQLEIDTKVNAVKSLEGCAKLLMTEASNMRQMYSAVKEGEEKGDV